MYEIVRAVTRMHAPAGMHVYFLRSILLFVLGRTYLFYSPGVLSNAMDASGSGGTLVKLTVRKIRQLMTTNK